MLHVIYYAGHGVTNKYRETFGVIPYIEKIKLDTGEIIEQKRVEYFNFTNFANEMAKFSKCATIIILDCCREFKQELNSELQKGILVQHQKNLGICYLIEAVSEGQYAGAIPTGEFIENFYQDYICYMETFSHDCCISDQYQSRQVNLHVVYKLEDKNQYICQPCYMKNSNTVQTSVEKNYYQDLAYIDLPINTDYPAIARFDSYIFISGGHRRIQSYNNQFDWTDNLYRVDLASYQPYPELLHQFKKFLITPTLLCNKLLSQIDKSVRGLQFFYLGYCQVEKLSRIYYYSQPNLSQERMENEKISSQNQEKDLNTYSINNQLKELNYTYSYPAMFIFQGYYLILYGGINIITLETTNRLLMINIEDFRNPKVTEIAQDNTVEEKYCNQDYFFGNQILENKANNFKLRGQHGIYKASLLAPNKISVVKVFSF
ncbi:UNKNOWN [Stylonychia lemnae]|uniref:Uncharacterized protein n=1 Tax=Stylonychia lemnae TaxID=5949 RepID=A0A077ZMS5_STYLE|nr:UNKNOWN [Stylonychia lemnae]|eukprot:CDW71233.1 UNKNOWN [Stylonychia lemnae]